MYKRLVFYISYCALSPKKATNPIQHQHKSSSIEETPNKKNCHIISISFPQAMSMKNEMDLSSQPEEDSVWLANDVLAVTI